MAEKKKKTKKDKKWIQSAIKRPGTFTAKAKKKGITTAQLQANVEKTRKQAQLRETLVKLNQRKKTKK